MLRPVSCALCPRAAWVAARCACRPPETQAGQARARAIVLWAARRANPSHLTTTHARLAQHSPGSACRHRRDIHGPCPINAHTWVIEHRPEHQYLWHGRGCHLCQVAPRSLRGRHPERRWRLACCHVADEHPGEARYITPSPVEGERQGELYASCGRVDTKLTALYRLEPSSQRVSRPFADGHRVRAVGTLVVDSR